MFQNLLNGTRASLTFSTLAFLGDRGQHLRRIGLDKLVHHDAIGNRLFQNFRTSA
jgi:hypothetical protein